MLRFLIGSGADVNASEKPRELPRIDFPESMEGLDLDPEVSAMLRSASEMTAGFVPDAPPMAVAVAKNISLEKLDVMLEAGMDPGARSGHGYTMAITAAFADRMGLIRHLLQIGVGVEGETSYGESILGVLSSRGHFAELRELLEQGLDPAPLRWTPLLHAVAFGSPEEVAGLVEAGADLEAADRYGRTAFLMAVHRGDTAKAAFLLSKGAGRHATGHCGWAATHYAASRNDTKMLGWLLDQGFDPGAEDSLGNTPLGIAAGHRAADAFRLLLDACGNWEATPAERKAVTEAAADPRIVRLLLERGVQLREFEAEAIRDLIGLGTAEELSASEEEYLAGRFPRFGTANPERMAEPFWEAMVRCGWSGFRAADRFGDSSFGREEPVWSHDRFGMSTTPLPDGRFIQIAGEHEDHYDPDFCIYNDVVIHDGKGGIEILGYPEEVFPPTDFHSATFVAPWIYIIGNLGYPEARRGDHTPVYRFHVETGRIEAVATSGECPGWIHSHEAVPEEGGSILISGGKVIRFSEDGSQTIEDQNEIFRLNPASGAWTRL